MNLDAVGGPAGAWLIAALLLGAAELAVPGVFLMFLAIAAAITAALALALPDLPAAAQLGSFAIWSAVAVLIGRRWYADYAPDADPMLNDRATRLVGEVVTVETALRGGRGRVVVGDATWSARGPDADAGSRLRVVKVEGGVLLVAPLDDGSPG